MGLEKEKEEIQEKIKEKGEEKLSKEDVRKDVLAVMAEEREKTAATENLGSIRKQVDHLEGEMGEVKKVLCAPGGGPCFTTQEQLDAYLKATDEKIGKIGTLLTEVVEKVSNMKAPKAELLGGLERLENMTEEKRKTFTEEENRLRDGRVDKIEDFFRVSDNDRWRKLRRTEVNLDIISGKPEMISRVLKAIPSMPQDQKGKIIQVVCTDKSCRVQLEKEQGTRIYKQDDRGKWKWLDEPEKEGPHI